MTTNLKLSQIPGNVLVKPSESGLAKDSVIIACQVMTINRSDLGGQAGSVPAHILFLIDEGLSESLEIIK